MAGQQVARHTDGSITLWVEGQPYLLRDSTEQYRTEYGRLAALWRARAATLWFKGETQRAQVWVQLADGAEAMGRRLEERW